MRLNFQSVNLDRRTGQVVHFVQPGLAGFHRARPDEDIGQRLDGQHPPGGFAAGHEHLREGARPEFSMDYRLLSGRLSQAMLASRRSGRYGALLFLDLDNFKPFNDTHGHAAGDLLLIEVVKRLKSCVREIDTVARMGGDEFVVMLSELEADKTESNLHTHTIAEKIRITLAESYQLIIKHDGEPDTSIVHRCPASIGVELFINHESSQDDILKWADAAMYQAKVGGRNQIRFHEAVLPHPGASAS